MENCVSYPDQVIQDGTNLWRLPWLDEPFLESSDDAASLKAAFNVVEKLMKTFALLKRSTDITMYLRSRIQSAQVLDIPGIGYLITFCIGNSV